jgi:hypothetical protein
VEGLTLEQVGARAPVALLEGGVLVEGSGQQPVGQWPVHEHADVVLGAPGQDVGLYVAAEEVVGRLQALHRERALQFGHLVCIEVRHADVADLAGLDELGQRLAGVGERGLVVRPMDLVEIDVVDAQGLQALVDALAQPGGGGVAQEVVALLAQAALGGDDQFVAVCAQLVAQRRGQQTLGGAPAVALGGVEEVDTKLAGAADGLVDALVLEGAPVAAQLPGAEADGSYLQAGAAESDRVHGRACYPPMALLERAGWMKPARWRPSRTAPTR